MHEATEVGVLLPAAFGGEFAGARWTGVREGEVARLEEHRMKLAVSVGQLPHADRTLLFFPSFCSINDIGRYITAGCRRGGSDRRRKDEMLGDLMLQKGLWVPKITHTYRTVKTCRLLVMALVHSRRWS